jgi:uncharacterized membrane protein YphA (DoxX/SURF4 family)
MRTNNKPNSQQWQPVIMKCKMNKETSIRIRRVVAEVISALFVLLFIYAALSKLKDFEKFEVQLAKSPLLNVFVEVIAWTIPFVELTIAVMLMLMRLQYTALYAAFTLMVIFSAYIVAILKFSSYIPCSCGGILQNMSWSEHLYFNIGFIILGIIGVLIYPDQHKELIGHKRESLNPLSKAN